MEPIGKSSVNILPGSTDTFDTAALIFEAYLLAAFKTAVSCTLQSRHVDINLYRVAAAVST